jgi:hypothetical protein
MLFPSLSPCTTIWPGTITPLASPLNTRGGEARGVFLEKYKNCKKISRIFYGFKGFKIFEFVSGPTA